MNKDYSFKAATSFFKQVKKFVLSSKLTFLLMGIGTTIWFLIRVIPKPQRAAYPCMKAAAPIMSGFFIYILSLGGASLLFKSAVQKFKKAKYFSAIGAAVLSLILIVVFFTNDVKSIYSNVFGVTWTKGELVDAPNTPMGTGWGIFPGRVAWTYDKDATNENCPNTIDDAYFMPNNYNQDVVNVIANKAVILIGGKATVKESWDAIFQSFNQRKTGTTKGYTAGEKIFIKVNSGQAGWAIDDSNLAEISYSGYAMANTSPSALYAFICQLVDSCGVAQKDIIVGEPMTHVYKSFYDAVNPKYPDVIFIDKEDRSDVGRTQSSGWKSNAIVYSDKGNVMKTAKTDALMNEMYNAAYMINLGALKAHARAGVTMCAKNHFGSHGIRASGWNSEHLHDGLISIKGNDRMGAADYPRTAYGMYRVLTDLSGHEKLGLNTVLFVVDALWSGIEATDMPVKWKMAPFNDDFPSSLFVSQDQIAVESVSLDFLRSEAALNSAFNNRPFFPAVDDYLHQAATKACWPDTIKAVQLSSTAPKKFPFAGYDPEGDGTLMPASLGVHEHWNNSTNKQYSKNLYSNGTGIELVSYPASLVTSSTSEASKSVTVIVKENNNALPNSHITIKGSTYLTDETGKVVVYNLVNGENITIVAKSAGTTKSESIVVGDSNEVTFEFSNGTSSIKNETSKNGLSVYPNPCSSIANISYALKSNSQVAIFIVSTEGKIVKNIKNERLNSGSYTDKINIEDINSGSYFCVLKVNSSISSTLLQKK